MRQGTWEYYQTETEECRTLSGVEVPGIQDRF